MRTHRRGFDVSSLERAPDQLRDGAAGRQATKRRIDPQKEVVVIPPRTKMLKIVQHGVAGILGEREPGLATTFPDDAHSTL